MFFSVLSTFTILYSALFGIRSFNWLFIHRYQWKVHWKSWFFITSDREVKSKSQLFIPSDGKERLLDGVMKVTIYFILAPLKCHLNSKLVQEIHSYKPVVQLIKEAVVDENAPLRNSTWTELTNFVDDYGSRLAGTQNLENAIDFLLTRLKSAKLDNVHGENASVPRWVR